MSSLTNINIQSKTMNGLNTINADEITTDNFSATTLGATNLTVSGTITLPSASIADTALTSNIPLKNASNAFSQLNTFSNGISLADVANITMALANRRLNLRLTADTSHYIQYVNTFTGANGGVIDGVFITGYSGGALLVSSGLSQASNVLYLQWKNNNVYFFKQITAQAGIDASATQTINFGINAPTMKGTNITFLPDNALSSNVPLKNAYNGFSGTNAYSNTGNDNITVFNLGDTNNYLAITKDASIAGYNSSTSTLYWVITQLGVATLRATTITEGLTVSATQTINFGTNAPTMYGTNITNIPASSFIGYANLVYKNIQNYFTDVQHFQANVQFENPTVNGDLFQAKKNSGTGNAGHLLFSGNGTLSYFDDVTLANRWKLDDVGKLTTGTITTTATTGNVFETNSGISPYTFIGADGSIGRTDTVAGTGLFWKLLPNGYVQIKGATGFKSWNFQGASFFYYNLSGNPQIIMDGDAGTVEIPTSLKIGNSTYAPNNGKFTVNFGQNTTSNAPNSVVIGYNAGPLLGASASLNVVIGSQALAVNTNTQQTTAIGYLALNKHTGTGGNSAVGCYAGMELLSGTGNNFYGSASGGGLRINCNYCFAMGASAMGSSSGIMVKTLQYTGVAIINVTFIDLGGMDTSAIDAYQIMTSRRNGVVFSTRVLDFTYSGEMTMGATTQIATNSYIYFYDPGTLVVSTTYTGPTLPFGNTFTLPTGLVGITSSLVVVYTTNSLGTRKYVSVSSYNSTTGVLVVASSIILQSGSNMKFWTTNFNDTRGQNIQDSVGMGKYALGNIGSNTSQNTAFGVASLNGDAGGYNNITYLNGSQNCGFGANSGMSISGSSSNNVFVGANSDFAGGLDQICNNSVAVGGSALIIASNAVACGSSSIAYTTNSSSFGYGSKANSLTGISATAIGSLSIANGEFSTTLGTSSKTISDFSIASGGTAYCFGTDTSAYGYFSQATNTYASAYGSTTLASGLASSVFGANSISNGPSTSTFGANSVCSPDKGIAIGCDVEVQDTASWGIAIGCNSRVTEQGGIALGYLSQALHQESIAIGTSVVTSAVNQIVIGKSTHQVDVAGQLRITSTGSMVVQSGSIGITVTNSSLTLDATSTFQVQGIYQPYEVYPTIFTGATTLQTNIIWGLYRLKSPSTATITLTLPIASVDYDAMTITFRRVSGGSAGAWFNNTNIVNFSGVLQVGLLTTTQSSVALTCMSNGTTYNWYMMNLH